MPRYLVMMIIVAVATMVIEVLVVQNANRELSSVGYGTDTREKAGSLNLIVLIAEVALAVLSTVLGGPNWVKLVGVGFAVIWLAIYLYLMIRFYLHVYAPLSRDGYLSMSFPRYLFEDMMGKKFGLYSLSMIAVIATWLLVA